MVNILRIRMASLTLICVVTFPTSSITSADTLRTVALSAAPAPGTSTGVNFGNFFSDPVLNDAGQTAFRGILTGTGVTFRNDAGLWSEGNGTLKLVARDGSHAPGTPNGVSYGTVNMPIINGSGRIAFRGVLTGTGVTTSNETGIWSDSNGTLELVAREGDSAPGTAVDVKFSNMLFSPSFNDAGQTAFRASLTGIGVTDRNDTGIWSEGSGTLELVAREGSHATGTTSGVNFGTFFSDPVLNDAGQTAFAGLVTGAGVFNFNNNANWSEGTGELKLVVREGQIAPGTTTLSIFDSAEVPVLNNRGQSAFTARIRGGSGSSLFNDFAIWSEGTGTLNLVVREGSNAPGTASGVKFSEFGAPTLNGKGQIAFRGGLVGTGVTSSNDIGIWSWTERAETLELVARSGNNAPGTAVGVNFSDFGSPAYNAAGQIAFFGSLSGAEVDDSNNEGIWAEDLAGNLKLIARTGDLLDVDDGSGTDLRTILGLSFFASSGNEDGRRSGFNELGQLAFRATFTDGSIGLFVSNLVAVPEPASLLLGVMAVPVLFYRVREKDPKRV